ncbi:MAG TPA: aminomethyltransferase beta-barrel domain-containing protein, partial [Acetobacteraceae bacterium]
QLSRSLFPLGAMPDKAAVRAEADRLGLPVAAKPDSQDICFVPSGSYADVVARLRPDAAEPGEIVSTEGEVLGRHDGIARYTVGQARRLGTVQSGGARRVVVALDPATRRVVVGPPGGGTREVVLREVNWLTAPRRLRCAVKLRARSEPQPAEIIPTEEGARVLLDEPSLPAPGQACVFYDGDRVLGGGFIRAPHAPG